MQQDTTVRPAQSPPSALNPAAPEQGWQLLAPDVDVEPELRLDGAQRQVVDHRDGPLLVLGGPGTGKTSIVVESVAARVAEGENPASILVLTFDRRAAVALRERIARRLNRPGAVPRVSTFHGLCHALVRRFGEEDATPRLLTAPEQEFRVRELLAGQDQAAWPKTLHPALPTRAFAAQVRAVIAHARQLGLDPDELAKLGERAQRSDWRAVGTFMAEYLDVLDAEGVLDYAELVHRSRILLADPAVRRQVNGEIARIYIDEYQDLDQAQSQLMMALCGPRRNLAVFGDPDQSVDAFRGAHTRGIVDFPQAAARPGEPPVPVIALPTNYRHGVRIAAATAGIARRLPVARSLPGEMMGKLRSPAPIGSAGKVEAYAFDSAGAQAEHIADLLRGAHLRDGLDWSQMAVLVRSGRRGIPPLSRALLAAGVPIHVAGDEIALAAEPAVRPLLLGCQVVAAGAPDADQAHRLLTSPLCGLDSLGIRRLGRGLRAAERAEWGGGAPAMPTTGLVHRALAQPELLDACAAQPEAQAARRLVTLLTQARAQLINGASAAEILWTLWSGTDWPQRLRATALGGRESARRADRDLDAVMALFDVAERSSELRGARGLAAFGAEVEAQQIPADTHRESGTSHQAVRILTAHRAKGLQWPLVVVAGVQEGVWPDLRCRDSLLEPERLGRDGVGPRPPASVRVAQERRLFYLACTRAQRRLVVTAVAGTEGEGDQPSRFLGELGTTITEVAGRPVRPLNLSGLIAELRRVSVDPDEPSELREAAARRLARLAQASDDDGRPLAPAAAPQNWWGLADPSDGSDPPGGRDRSGLAEREQLILSGSEVGALHDCPRRWFLSRRARAERGGGSAALFGAVVHALIQDDADVALQRIGELDHIWDRLTFDAHWLSAIERVEAESAVHRWAAWTEAREHRELLGAEVPFTATVTLPGAPAVRIVGRVDRLERTADGRLFVVDYKTSRHAMSPLEASVHDQLGLYQLAARLGAFEEYAPGVREVAGGELVFLRLQEKNIEQPWPQTRVQPSLDELPHPDQPTGDLDRGAYQTWVHQRVAEAARIADSGQFEARRNHGCRHCPFANSCPTQPAGEQVVA